MLYLEKRLITNVMFLAAIVRPRFFASHKKCGQEKWNYPICNSRSRKENEQEYRKGVMVIKPHESITKEVSKMFFYWKGIPSNSFLLDDVWEHRSSLHTAGWYMTRLQSRESRYIAWSRQRSFINSVGLPASKFSWSWFFAPGMFQIYSITSTTEIKNDHGWIHHSCWTVFQWIRNGNYAKHATFWFFSLKV